MTSQRARCKTKVLRILGQCTITSFLAAIKDASVPAVHWSDGDHEAALQEYDESKSTALHYAVHASCGAVFQRPSLECRIPYIHGYGLQDIQ